MMKISLIAAVAENYVIGKNNDLPWRLSDDLKWFKSVTKGHHIIMGRKNYEAFRKPLPHRTNIIVTRNKDYEAEGCIVVDSIEKGLNIARENNDGEAFIIGGGEIYRQSLSIADKMYITWVHAEVEGDVYFPEFDKAGWEEEVVRTQESNEKNEYPFTICIYEKNH